MKVWIVNQFANTPDQPGHTRQFDLSQELARQGHEVTVISSDFNLAKRTYSRTRISRPFVRERIGNADFLWIYALPYQVSNWRRYANMFSFALLVLFATLFQRSPDVIVGSSPQLPAAYVAWLVARLKRVRYVLEVRDLWPQVLIDMGGKTEDSRLVRLLRRLEGRLYNSSDSVIVLARGAIEYVKSRNDDADIHWLPNSVSIADFAIEESRDDLRDRLSLPCDEVVLVYAGAHGDANALDTIVEACRILEPKGLAARVVLYGDGTRKADIASAAAGLKMLELRDPVPKAEIPKILAAADAGILTLKDVQLFRYGVSPNKLYDYYAAGRPVIAAVGGHVNAEVEEEGIGFTAEPEDGAGLAAAIEKFVELSAEERLEMGGRARGLAERRYNRKVVADGFENVLTSVLRKAA